MNNQPRIPKGLTTGGQWTKPGNMPKVRGSSAGSERLSPRPSSFGSSEQNELRRLLNSKEGLKAQQWQRIVTDLAQRGREDLKDGLSLAEVREEMEITLSRKHGQTLGFIANVATDRLVLPPWDRPRVLRWLENTAINKAMAALPR